MSGRVVSRKGRCSISEKRKVKGVACKGSIGEIAILLRFNGTLLSQSIISIDITNIPDRITIEKKKGLVRENGILTILERYLEILRGGGGHFPRHPRPDGVFRLDVSVRNF